MSLECILKEWLRGKAESETWPTSGVCYSRAAFLCDSGFCSREQCCLRCSPGDPQTSISSLWWQNKETVLPKSHLEKSESIRVGYLLEHGWPQDSCFIENPASCGDSNAQAAPLKKPLWLAFSSLLIQTWCGGGGSEGVGEPVKFIIFWSSCATQEFWSSWTWQGLWASPIRGTSLLSGTENFSIEKRWLHSK